MLVHDIERRLRQARQRHDTVVAMAAATGVSRSGLNSYLNGTKNIADMTVETFGKLARELGYDLSAHPAPAALGELAANWDRLPPATQAHLKFVIDSVLQAHGLAAGNGPGASSRPKDSAALRTA
jgi:transcriptional regulator with XRE-family HTH domain